MSDITKRFVVDRRWRDQRYSTSVAGFDTEPEAVQFVLEQSLLPDYRYVVYDRQKNRDIYDTDADTERLAAGHALLKSFADQLTHLLAGYTAEANTEREEQIKQVLALELVPELLSSTDLKAQIARAEAWLEQAKAVQNYDSSPANPNSPFHEKWVYDQTHPVKIIPTPDLKVGMVVRHHSLQGGWFNVVFAMPRSDGRWGVGFAGINTIECYTADTLWDWRGGAKSDLVPTWALVVGDIILCSEGTWRQIETITHEGDWTRISCGGYSISINDNYDGLFQRRHASI